MTTFLCYTCGTPIDGASAGATFTCLTCGVVACWTSESFITKEQELLARIYTRHTPPNPEPQGSIARIGAVAPWDPNTVMLALKDAYAEGRRAENHRLTKLDEERSLHCPGCDGDHL